jgi:hypothetical protein
VGNPWVLRLDWSQLPEDCLSSPGTAQILQRTLDALPARHRAAVLVDTEGMAAADVAAGLGEPPEMVRRRLHEVRMGFEPMSQLIDSKPPRRWTPMEDALPILVLVSVGFLLNLVLEGPLVSLLLHGPAERPPVHGQAEELTRL